MQALGSAGLNFWRRRHPLTRCRSRGMPPQRTCRGSRLRLGRLAASRFQPDSFETSRAACHRLNWRCAPAPPHGQGRHWQAPDLSTAWQENRSEL